MNMLAVNALRFKRTHRLKPVVFSYNKTASRRFVCAQERTRTSNPLRELAPHASAYTNSATWANVFLILFNPPDSNPLRNESLMLARLPAVLQRCRRAPSGHNASFEGGSGIPTPCLSSRLPHSPLPASPPFRIQREFQPVLRSLLRPVWPRRFRCHRLM